MAGKVFISCGQRPPEETEAADRVSHLLRTEFQLEPYTAFRVQSLGDIMAITKELRAADYYLLIDFARRQDGPNDLPCSLFTHQELALAHQLGFREQVIALRQEGAPLEGFLRYVQCNPEPFQSTDDLLEKVRRLVRSKGWNPSYSRNLVIGPVTQTDLLVYGDHAGSSMQVAWQTRIENRRPDVAAVGAVCILDSMHYAGGQEVPCNDRAYLKWAGQAGYERTILPQDFGLIDLFAVRPDVPGLFLHSLRDTPRSPVLTENGDYQLAFKVFARDFPILNFTVNVQLRWQQAAPSTWANQTSATLKQWL
jgi:hypothetical protein